MLMKTLIPTSFFKFMMTISCIVEQKHGNEVSFITGYLFMIVHQKDMGSAEMSTLIGDITLVPMVS